MLNKNLIGIIVNYIGFYKGINFNVPFYEKYMDKLDWDYLPGNNNIPYRFFKKYLSNEKYKDKINWYSLSQNTNIPVEFFEKELCDKYYKINWFGLSKNTNIPYTFFLPGGRETVKNI
jgi:hypothetical protein